MAGKLVGLEFLKKNEIRDKPCDFKRPYAFISYSHDDHDAQIVMNVFDKLYSKGYNLWIDTANIPHNENKWSKSAIMALKNKHCRFAFFFRSETSMVKETIAKELEIIKHLEHIECIVTVDIWDDEDYSASKYYHDLLNGDDDTKFDICDKICEFVDKDNSAIRLATDVENDILELAKSMEAELIKLGVRPVQDVGDPPPPPPPPPKPSEPPESPVPPDPPSKQTITLPEFLKQYNISTFKKGTFQEFRLVGQGEAAKYNSGFYDSSSRLVRNFVECLLRERGEPYIHFVNAQNAGSKNPPFITAEQYKQRKDAGSNISYCYLKEAGLEDWTMCNNFGQYTWISEVLCKRIQELGLPLESFSLEYLPGTGKDGGKTAKKKTESEKKKTESARGKGIKPTGGIKGTITLGGQSGKKQVLEKDGYHITLYGEQYTGLKLKDMLLTVFKETLDRHPDKLELLLDKLSCLGRGDLIRPDAQPATFRAGETYMVNGTEISIGTSQGQSQVLSNIRRLMALCGEPKANLVIEGYDY